MPFMFIRFLLFGCLGLLWEVAFGAVKAIIFQRRFDLRGETSLWMLPFYGLVAFLYPFIAHRVGHFPWWGRGLIYMTLFFLFEFSLGWALTRLKICPWKYTGKYTVQGLVNLPYAPAWFVAGLLVEWLYPWIVAMSHL